MSRKYLTLAVSVTLVFAFTAAGGLSYLKFDQFSLKSTISNSKAAGSTAYNSTILADNPVAFWAMSSQTGTETDLSGHGNTGTYKGGIPAATTTMNGDQTAVFNGTNQYMTVPSNSALSISTTKQLTWEAWIRPDTLQFPNSVDGYVDWMGKCQEYSPSCEWEARMYDTTNADNRCNRLSAYAFNSTAGLGSGAYWQPNCGLLQAGQWLHVVGEYQTQTTPSGCNTAYPGTISIWVNGVPWNFASHSPTGCMSQYNILPSTGSSPLNIGTVALDYWFKGSIGKVAVYNNLLSQAQINAHFTAMTGAAPAGSCANTCTTAVPTQAASIITLDTTAPTVSISSPVTGQKTSNTLTVTGSATDNIGVTKVELLVDDVVKVTDSTAPFASFSWDTKTVGDGAHSLTLKAYDSAGNAGVSGAVNITITNSLPPPAPIISSFTASPSAIIAGNSTTLSWVTQNVSTCDVQGGTTNTTAKSWTTPVLTTTGTKTYTLVCYNPAVVSTTKTVTITVNAAPTPPNKPTFTSDKNNVQTGGTVNFSWSSGGATSCVFNPGNVGGAGTVNGKPVSSITTTTTYNLSCSNAAGTTQATPITITVSNAPVVAANPVITSFTATPSSIGSGEKTTFKWTTTGVVSAGCRINPGTIAEPNGSLTTGALTDSVNYNLTCSNVDGKTTSSNITVTVAGKTTSSVSASIPSTVDKDTATASSVKDPQTGATVANASTNSAVAGLASLDISNVVDTTKAQSITYVEYYDGEKLIQKVDKAPFALDTRLLKNGSYSITERTYYLDGSKSEVTKVLGVENAEPSVQGAEAGAPIQKNPVLYVLLILTVIVAVLALVTRRRWLPIAGVVVVDIKAKFVKTEAHPTQFSEPTQLPGENVYDPQVIRPDNEEES